MKKIGFIFITVLSLFFISCKKKSSESIPASIPNVEVKKSNHTWYYFTDSNYVAVDKPQNAPAGPEIPWTEALRISSAAINEADVTGGSGPDAFAVVNRLGILSFEDDKIILSKDVNLFTERTAGNLVFLDRTPVFSVYKSSFFNDSIKNPEYKNDESQHLFILQFDSVSGISYPIVNCNNLWEEKNSEITDFYWDGLNWLCSVKTISDSKNSFSYINWKPSVPLLSLSPSGAKNNISVKEISVDTFREARKPISYSKAPERIKKLLAGFSDSKSFNIEVHSAGSCSPRNYENSIENYDEKALSAKAILADSWSSVLFEDGTLFIEGALTGKHILRNGKPVAIRLPKLPGGFVYSDFVISGTTLYAAWEEADFYNVKRSGFIKVDLEKTLYSKLI